MLISGPDYYGPPLYEETKNRHVRCVCWVSTSNTLSGDGESIRALCVLGVDGWNKLGLGLSWVRSAKSVTQNSQQPPFNSHPSNISRT